MFRSVFFLFFFSNCSVRAQSWDVPTDQGVVRGYTVDDDSLYSFYGIPYATAPTEEDRFKAPLPPPSWLDVFNATERHILCPQPNTYKYEVIITMDCLRVNVFVPKTNETSLPVVVYTFGGGFQNGFAEIYSPVNLVKRGMIFVNYNYRVGVHGQLCLNTEYAPGNAGMKDQVAALKWVKRNIANFGGNPNDITVDGSSSGGVSVELQILSPMSDGLFTRAVTIGGPGLTRYGVTYEPLEIAASFAQQFGVKTGQDVARLESFYRSLTDDQLHIAYNADYKHVGFMPCVETHNISGVEKFFTEYPIDILINKNYEKVPFMTGFNSMDGLMINFLGNYDAWKPTMENNFREILPGTIQFDSEEQAVEMTQLLKDFYFPTGEITIEGFVLFFTDMVFAFPLYSSVRLHTRNGMPVYLFMLSYNGTVNLPGVHRLMRYWGPGHVTPLLYMQEHIESFIYDNMTKEEFILKDILSDLYYHFVKDGIPSSELVNETWLLVSHHAEYLHIEDEALIHMDQYPLRERMRIWDRIYHYPYFNSADSSAFCERPFCFSFVLLCFYLSTLLMYLY